MNNQKKRHTLLQQRIRFTFVAQRNTAVDVEMSRLCRADANTPSDLTKSEIEPIKNKVIFADGVLGEVALSIQTMKRNILKQLVTVFFYRKQPRLTMCLIKSFKTSAINK